MLDENAKQPINDGVQMLLNRMDSHPEEFMQDLQGSDTRWDWVLDRIQHRMQQTLEGSPNAKWVLPFLTDDEVQALYAKYIQINRDLFKQSVMKELLCMEQGYGRPLPLTAYEKALMHSENKNPPPWR